MNKTKQSIIKDADLKILPHAHETEQSFLGGLMLDSSAWDKVCDLISSSDFYSRAHKLIFQAMEKLALDSSPLDLITVSEKLELDQQIEEVGSFAYLATIAKNTPSANNICSYAKIIHERAVARDIIQAAQNILDLSFYPEGKNVYEILDAAEKKILDISDSRFSEQDGPQTVVSAITKAIDKLDMLYKDPSNGGVTGLSTGFSDLDELTAGLQPSDLVVVAARPSMGKTTFAINICEHVMLNQDKPVLVFSLEMPLEQIMMRILSSQGRIDQNKMRTGRLTEDDWARLFSVMKNIKENGNLFIDDSSSLTPIELRAKSRRIAKEHGLSLIMVDYLQLMRSSSATENRALEISEISRSLKALAKELQVPVVALSQLNRSLEQRSNKKPQNSDLRESGSIEQDADLIMFIYRDEVYNENSTEKGLADIIIGKQRNGPIGSVKLAFMGQHSRFGNHFNDSSGTAS